MTELRMTQTMLRPDYKEFSRLAEEATLVPVVKSVAADLLTPVSAFLAIAANEPDAFLLESVERGEQIGRYTFLGARPYMQVRARGGDIEVQRGKKKEKRQGSAIQVIKELLRQHRPAAVPGLPPFTAGAVGYFAYDAVRQLENIGEHAKDDFSLPDCVLMFFDRLLAFDHLRHQIHIIATADVSRESPRRAYDRAAAGHCRPGKETGGGIAAGALAQDVASGQGQTESARRDQRKRFIESVERAKEYIAAGDIFQVVLSQRLDFTPAVAPFDVYRALRTVNPSPYLYFLAHGRHARAGLVAGDAGAGDGTASWNIVRLRGRIRAAATKPKISDWHSRCCTTRKNAPNT